MKKYKLTLEELKQLIHYDPETGDFTWLKVWHPKANRVKVGEKTGSADKKGYLLIQIKGVRYRANRLAWFYMTGEWADLEVEHKDRDRANNKWENLRLATRAQNNSNQSLRKDNTSGYKGVRWSTTHQKWNACVQCEGLCFHLGYFDDILEAARAYDAKARDLHGEFAYLNFPNEELVNLQEKVPEE